MGKVKKKKSSGTWLTREMCMSRAYLSLTGFSPQLLSLFLLKRDFTASFECKNCHNLTMTYAKLENIFNQGNRNPMNKSKDGISRPRIIRAIDELLAKGFIEIVWRGGKFQKDKTIYALSDKWRFWSEGTVFNKRKKGNPWSVKNKSDA